MTQAADHDTNIILPDRDITVCGRAVHVREIRFAQSSQAMTLMAPVIDGLQSLKLDPAVETLALEPLEALIAEHWNPFLDFMALSTGQPRSWLGDLPDHAGQELAMTVLAVNAGFFLRRLLGRQMAGAPGPSDSAPSSSPSSRPASGATGPTSQSA